MFRAFLSWPGAAWLWPVAAALAAGAYVAIQFAAPTFSSIAVAGCIGAFVGLPFGLVIGFSAFAVGSLVLREGGGRNPADSSTALRFAFALATTAAAIIPTAVAMMLLGQIVLSVGVACVALVAFAASYMYFPSANNPMPPAMKPAGQPNGSGKPAVTPSHGHQVGRSASSRRDRASASNADDSANQVRSS